MLQYASFKSCYTKAQDVLSCIISTKELLWKELFTQCAQQLRQSRGEHLRFHAAVLCFWNRCREQNLLCKLSVEKWSRMNQTWSDYSSKSCRHNKREKAYLPLGDSVSRRTVFFQASQPFCIIKVISEQHPGVTHRVFSHLTTLQNASQGNGEKHWRNSILQKRKPTL